MTGVLEGQGVLLAGVRPLLDIAMADAFVGAGARVMMDDRGSRERVEGVVADAVSTYGRLDVLVTDSGVPRPGNVDEITDDDVERSWGAAVLGCVGAMQVAYPHLRRGGRIVNVLSTSSRGADTRGVGLVAACEEAIRTISRTAAVEWGRDGIRVNALGVPTASADIDAVASVAVFLASPASRYITGSLMIADGGRTILR